MEDRKDGDVRDKETDKDGNPISINRDDIPPEVWQIIFKNLSAKQLAQMRLVDSFFEKTANTALLDKFNKILEGTNKSISYEKIKNLKNTLSTVFQEYEKERDRNRGLRGPDNTIRSRLMDLFQDNENGVFYLAMLIMYNEGLDEVSSLAPGFLADIALISLDHAKVLLNQEKFFNALYGQNGVWIEQIAEQGQHGQAEYILHNFGALIKQKDNSEKMINLLTVLANKHRPDF